MRYQVKLDMLEQKEVTLLAFDFGMKRIGVAVGSTLINQAKPLQTLSARDGIPNWDHIKALIADYQPTGLVVGIPLNIDNTEQQTTFAARKFSNRLREKFRMPVHCVDERFTTVEARQQVFDEGGYKALQETQIDSYAAKLILEQYLRMKRNTD